MRVIPIVGVVVAAVLIVIGRTQRNNPVAIAGYILLALTVVLGLYLRSRSGA
jgi:disulfide bond formation protein DsbB